MSKIYLALLIVLTVETGAQDLREGDLVFQTSQSRQSLAIRRVTRSPLTHVGVVQERGQWFVAEAIGPVQLTPYPLFLARGEGTKVLIKRWRAGLSPTQMRKMRAGADSGARTGTTGDK